jgi:hypothetical protein
MSWRLNAAGIGRCLILAALTLALLAQAQPQIHRGDDISRWKTFASRAGWSIRYPPDWRISSCRQCTDPTGPGVFVFFSTASGEVHVMLDPLADKSAKRSTRQWLNQVQRATVLNPVLSKRWMFIDGVPALKVVNGTSDSDRTENIYLAHGAKTLAIRFSDIGDAPMRSICQQMLSTFRLSPP